MPAVCSGPYINYYAYVKLGNTWESMSVSTRSFGLSRRMVLEHCFSNCGPRRSTDGFGRKALQKLYQTLNELRTHSYMSALKLHSLGDL
jgi:hypothetical protein